VALTLSKNQSISLEKTAGTSLSAVTLGLGWDPEKTGLLGRLFGGGGSVDLDASCIMFDAALQPVDLVWFRQLRSRDGSIEHSGDNRTGEGEGDDESIFVSLTKVPSSVQHLVFTTNSFTGQTFEKIQNAYCRILNTANGQELARFNLSEQGDHTGVVMAKLSRGATGWEFQAIGKPTNGRTADDLVSLAVRAIKP